MAFLDNYLHIISALLLALGTLFFLFVINLNRKLTFWKNRNVATPIDGVLSFLSGLSDPRKKPLHELQMDLYKKYGRVVGIYIGTIPALTVGEPHLLKNILVKDFNKFNNRIKFTSGEPAIDKMLSNLRDEDWKRVRCIMGPTFSSSRMRKMAYLIRECAEKFTKHFEKAAEENNGSLDCRRYLTNFSIDVIATTAYGTKMDSLDDPNNEFVNTARGISNADASLLQILTNLIPFLRRLYSINRVGESFRYLQKFAIHVIEQRERRKIKTNDFLQLMMDAQKGILEKTQEDLQDEDNENSIIEELPKHKTMNMEEMLAQCSLFLVAGNETTSNTLSFLLHYMALYPNCQEKLIKEVDDTWEKHKEITFDVLNKMPYLDCAVNETLRMQPIAITLQRECNEDYVLGDTGIQMTKLMTVFVPVYAMHHDPEFFPNPEVFNPERFSLENRKSIPQYAYLPFGDGPRNCLGMRFAMMVMKMCIVHLFRNLRVIATAETKCTRQEMADEMHKVVTWCAALMDQLHSEMGKPLEYYLGQGLLQPKEVIVKIEKRKH